MKSVLKAVENALPQLLNENVWKSLYVDYHKPFVKRLCTPFIF